MLKSYFHFEKKLSYALKEIAPTLIRYALGIIFFWFGILKVLDVSPVHEFVHESVEWLPKRGFLIFLGIWEMLTGILFMIKRLLRLALVFYFLHVIGTFLPLFTDTRDCFIYFPFCLTLQGQYVIKNIVFLAAVISLIPSLHQSDASEEPKKQ